MSEQRRQASVRRVCALSRWRPSGGARTGLLRKNPQALSTVLTARPTTLAAHHACTWKGLSRVIRASGRRNSDQAHPLHSSRSISSVGWAPSLRKGQTLRARFRLRKRRSGVASCA